MCVDLRSQCPDRRVGRKAGGLRIHGGPRGPLLKIDFDVILIVFWPFLAILGVILGLIMPLEPPPQIEGGTGQNAAKTGPNGPKMRFGAILDHLEATFIRFGPFGKVELDSSDRR